MSEIVARTGVLLAQTSRTPRGIRPVGSGRWSSSGARRACRTSPRLSRARRGPLHVGHENRHADAREAFGEQLQRDRLAGAVAPVMQPCRLARAGRRAMSSRRGGR